MRRECRPLKCGRISGKGMVSKMPQKHEAHVYDNTLKALFGDEAAEIISTLLPGNLHSSVKARNIRRDRCIVSASACHPHSTRGPCKPMRDGCRLLQSLQATESGHAKSVPTNGNAFYGLYKNEEGKWWATARSLKAAGLCCRERTVQPSHPGSV